MDALAIFEGLDCSVCLERLDETCKVLPCQHTFCKGCLKAIVASRQELRCPECRRLVTENVDELPRNIMLIRLLDGLKERQTRKHIASSTRSKIPFDEPCARARYSYDAREPGDLNLKKGDLIVLLQRIDENWFIGEISGHQGYLPANFVEVINPLPKFEETKQALARGIYDFQEDDEEDLLHFKQGDIITVLQRVDANWCEGEIDDRCGIFPVNFVELNRAASSMVSTNKSPEPETRRQPSIPQTTSEARLPRQKAQLHRPVRRSRSIPRENQENIRRRVREFGEASDSPGHGSLRVPNQNNRHSFDALSVERDFNLQDESSDALPTANANVAANRCSNARTIESRELQVDRSTVCTATRSSPTGFQTRDVQTSELYIALYNYRPQKNDELELCSGEHYKVLEKGGDGWFKGFPVLGRQQVGHFPGNYVRPVRSSNANQENTTDNVMSLIQRRRRKNNSQTSLNPDSALLVLPRPRPFSDISNDSNQDSLLTPPLTPPLVGAKPPKQSLFRRLSIGKKKDRSSPQTVQTERSNQQTDSIIPTSSSSSRATQLASSSRTRMDSRQGSRNCPSGKEKYVVIANYPPHSAMELEIKYGDIVYVTRKTENGWYHGTLERNGKVGFVPSSFLQKI